MLISIQKFTGIAPSIPPRQLAEYQAQVAVNCPMFYGTLQPLLDVGDIGLGFTLPGSGEPQTIYRFGLDTLSDTEYWFVWNQDVNVVRGPIHGDDTERTYYSDGEYPKVTDNTLALSGAVQFPAAYHRLGVPAPTLAPTLAVVGSATGSNPIAESRTYVYTWVTAWGEESAPSPPSDIVSVQPGQTVNLSAFDLPPSGAYPLASCRIYRSTSGVFLLVAEITLAQAQTAAPGIVYPDVLLAEALGEACPSLTWLPPPAALTGLVLMPNGFLAGFVERDVYLSDPFHPFAWPVANIQPMDYPVVGLGVMNTTLCVLTKGQPYWIQGADPANVTVLPADINQACVSKRSIVSMLGVVVYAGPDGLAVLNLNGSSLLTEKLFKRAQWQALNPASISAFQFESQYIGFYHNGAPGGFLFDFVSNTFQMIDTHAVAGYYDRVQDTLYLAFADRSVKKWLQGAAKAYVWKSKRFTHPYPVNYVAAKVQAEDYPLTAVFYADGELVLTQTVNDRFPFRLPAVAARDWEVELHGAVEVFAVALASSMDELGHG